MGALTKALSLVSALTLVSSQAMAQLFFCQDYFWDFEETTFNGSQCTWSDSGQTDGMQRLPPKLQNNLSVSRNAICPISRKRGNGVMNGGSVMVHSSSISDCKLRIRNWHNGLSYTYGPTDTQNVGGNNQIRWAWPNNFRIGENTSAAYTCVVPAGGAILTYNYDPEPVQVFIQ